MKERGISSITIGGEDIEIIPTPALYARLDEAAGGLLKLAEKIESGNIRHEELVEMAMILTSARVHREEIEKSILEDGAALYLGHITRLVTLYFAGMKKLKELCDLGEMQAPA